MLFYGILIAIVLDYIFGDPKKIPHPIIYIGKLIKLYEKVLIKIPSKKLGGLVLFIAVVGTVAGVIIGITALAGLNQYVSLVVNTYFIYTALAMKSLKDAGREVVLALEKGDIDKARLMLSYIVGRDTDNLSSEQIMCGTVETMSENTIDGVIAPLFYLMLGYFFGMPLLFIYLYKTVNTLDSMVGYKNEKYLHFGTVSARMDDVLNFIPARIGAMLMLLSGYIINLNVKNGFNIYKRDRYKHKSPNSAHSESVVAGMLDIRLGGPSYYFGECVEKPYIGDDNRPIELSDYIACSRLIDLSVLYTVIIFVGLELILL